MSTVPVESVTHIMQVALFVDSTDETISYEVNYYSRAVVFATM